MSGPDSRNEPDRILRAFGRLDQFNRILMGLIGFGLFAIVCTIVFSRYFFKVDIKGIEEFMYFALVWLMFLGGATGSYENSHVRADTIATLVKNKTVLRVNAFLQNTLTVLISGTFAFFALIMVRNNIQLPSRTTVHRMPFLIGYSAVLYSGILMFLYSALHYYSFLRSFFSGKTDPPPEQPADENGGIV